MPRKYLKVATSGNIATIVGGLVATIVTELILNCMSKRKGKTKHEGQRTDKSLKVKERER